MPQQQTRECCWCQALRTLSHRLIEGRSQKRDISVCRCAYLQACLLSGGQRAVAGSLQLAQAVGGHSLPDRHAPHLRGPRRQEGNLGKKQPHRVAALATVSALRLRLGQELGFVLLKEAREKRRTVRQTFCFRVVTKSCISEGRRERRLLQLGACDAVAKLRCWRPSLDEVLQAREIKRK